ncbi:hypothetical protein ACFWIW_10265 [Amycolatopsis sp. NPDC058340]|uniref:LexA family protein n=1 Tax=Amycolatopsis sp. NPDC058340 TaxID=3346453 RepID=UPI0036501AC4
MSADDEEEGAGAAPASSAGFDVESIRALATEENTEPQTSDGRPRGHATRRTQSVTDTRVPADRQPEQASLLTSSAAKLTVRERKVVEVIRSSVERLGYPPSIREIGEAVGLTSTSSVAYVLRSLEQKGLLRRDPNLTRAIGTLRSRFDLEMPTAASTEPGSTSSSERHTDAVGPVKPAPVSGNKPRLGFVVDVAGFGRRGVEEQKNLYHRIDTLADQVIADLGFSDADVNSVDAGDSKVVFLPEGVTSSRVVPRLISALTERLAQDNRRYHDRMRLRIAIGSGAIGTDPPGYTGELVTDLHRMVDSTVLRAAIMDNEDVVLALILADTIRDEVIRPGYLDLTDFTHVEVTTKEFTASGWLRLFYGN